MSDPTVPTNDDPERDAQDVTEPGATASPEVEAAAETPVEESAVAMAAAAAEPAPERAPRGPRPYAVIKTGGKQYRVSVGDRISVEKVDGIAGSEVTIDQVLLLGGDGSTRVGTPIVSGATVQARIEEQFRGDKIVVFKYKPKKRYRRKMGHRQSLTRLSITAINA